MPPVAQTIHDLDMPSAPEPIGNFRNIMQVGTLLYVSGQGPIGPDGVLRTGKVGRDVGTEQAYQDARFTGLTILSVLASYLGDLSRVKRVVKLLGFVNSTEDFADHPRVINGCSDLLVEVLGERGRHARSAIGVASLPNNITVEVEAIVEIHPEGTDHGRP